MTGYMRRSRLARLLAAHDRNEADIQALAVVSEPRACGCRWVPCDDHADAVLRAVDEDEDGEA